ncbi:hypothetical protein FRB98_009123 [Tulasnella sp. 332]|nr:hypothetical protein FRB98_009123 [Tulasnella sp. 332]
MPSLEEYRDAFLSAIKQIPLDGTETVEVSEVICSARGSDGQILGSILYNGWTVKGRLDVEQFNMTDGVPGGVWTDQPQVRIYGEAKPLNREQVQQVLSDSVNAYYEQRRGGALTTMSMDVPVRIK